MATGLKTGGRTKGTPNKATAAREAAPATDLIALAGVRTREAAPLLGVTGPAFPAYKLVRVDQLVPYANNARTHSDAQIAKIAASIREFGFTNPVLTDGRKGIVAGHGRILAARQLGLDMVPAIELAHLSAAQRRAYILADNRLALDAGWDDELLLSELTDLRDIGFDLALTAFDGPELDSLFVADAPDGAPFDETTEERSRCPTCGKFRTVSPQAERLA